MSRPEIWLSVDWDFFVREDPRWQWMHNESDFMRGMMWGIRESNALAVGIDLRKEMDPEVHGFPPPSAFWKQLFNFNGYSIDPDTLLAVSESHKAAGLHFLTYAPDKVGYDTHIVNFDAHHDLGYDEAAVKRNSKLKMCECQDWHYHVLKRHKKLTSLVVYPRWSLGTLGEHAGQLESFTTMNNLIGGRVTTKRWDDGALFVEPSVQPFRGGHVTRLFICRSGAWSPPWLDEAFAAFVEGVHAFHPEGRFKRFDYEPTPIRPHNDADVKHMADQLIRVRTEMINELKEKKP